MTKYKKGSLKITQKSKESGYIIIIKATGEQVPGTQQYPLDQEHTARAMLKHLEGQ